jgi:uncharacterized protein (DUF3084 family)
MSETPVKVIVDLSKPKGQRESIVPLTEDEIAERELMAQQAEAEQAATDQETADLAAAKQAAQDKLAALGLTEAEIAAITGA